MNGIEINEKEIALQLNINNRNFVITVDKKIFEKNQDGKLQKCSQKDKDVQALSQYLEPPKSLDII